MLRFLRKPSKRNLYSTCTLYKFRFACAAVLVFYPSHQPEAQEFAGPADLRIAIFTPTTEGNTYWPEVHRVMNCAAAELDVELMIHEFSIGDRFSKAEEGSRILRSDPDLDAAVFSVAFGQAQPLVETAEELGIPFFLHGPLFPQELEAIGTTPRAEYDYWIGYFAEDEEQKGYLLARELIAEAQARGSMGADDPVSVVGIGGDPSWYGSGLRLQGLRDAVADTPMAQLLQTVPTRWTPEEGEDITARLLRRYGNVPVVWAASDQLALGASAGLQASDMEPGRQAFTGGLDLSLVGLEAVRDGILTATVASPPLIWAQVLVYLYDYLHGFDFADIHGTEILFPPEIAIQSTVHELIEQRADCPGLDVRNYSRVHGGVEDAGGSHL